MASAGRVQTLLTCAKAQERRAMLPDGFSVGYFRLGTRLAEGHQTLFFLVRGRGLGTRLHDMQMWGLAQARQLYYKQKNVDEV